MQARAGKNSDIDDVDHSGSSVPRANPVGSGSGSPSRSSGSEIRRSRPGCDPSGDEVEHSEDEDGSSDEEGSGDDSEEDEDGLKGEIQQIFAVKGDGEEQRVLVKYKGKPSRLSLPSFCCFFPSLLMWCTISEATPAGLSHHHNNWVPGEEIWNTRKQLINNFIVKNGITGEYKDENGHPNGVNPVT